MGNVYRFVGRHSVIGDHEFTQIGQQASFSEAEFLEVSQNAAFITDEQFAALEIPPADLAKYGSAHYYGAIPQEFADAVEKARDAWRAMRAAVLLG